MKLSVGLFLTVVSTNCIAYNDAFTTIPRQHHSVQSFVPIRASTLEDVDKKRMTHEDGDVLFGGVTTGSTSVGRSKRTSNGNNKKRNKVPMNPLDRSNDPLINELHTIRNEVASCPDIWTTVSKACPNKKALLDEHLCDKVIDVTFQQMNDIVTRSAIAFTKLGVQPGTNVAILGENSARWLMADHGIQRAGASSAVRGADAPLDELRYIYEHSDSAGIVVLQDPRLLQKLIKDAQAKGMGGLGLSNQAQGAVRHVVLINQGKKHTKEDLETMTLGMGVKVHILADMIDGVTDEDMDSAQLPTLQHEDLATIVYTSGTTGSPKGVMLTHGNILHQLSHRLNPTMQYEDGEPVPDETMVSILPVWHITERTFELWMLARGCRVVYSSIRTLKKDMAKHKPEWMVLVPRVLEKIASGVQDKFASGSAVVQALSSFFTKTGSLRAKHTKVSQGLVVGDQAPNRLRRIVSKSIVAALAPLNAVGDKLVWTKVRDGFGGNLRMIIAGGSALSGSLESFYETCGLTVSVGYGLTECSPLLSFRRTDENLVTAGCVGKPTFDTEVRVVDPERAVSDDEERPALPVGEVGVVVGRGPQVMKGYYKNVEATNKAVDRFGWFDTGDLGRINPVTGDLILTGRAKDTIVLSNGENIEPQPIEDEILSQIPMIDQIMLTGQDGRRLCAVLTLSPNELASTGYVSRADVDALQQASETVNDPKCSQEDCAENASVLQAASTKLRDNAELQKFLQSAVKEATQSFRQWEQVSSIYVTLEPFAMANGLLTQSYKVKRDAVLQRYEAELPK